MHIYIQSIIDYESLISFLKRPLKAILLKTITQSISDYNFLSSLPLKERLNKEVLMHTIMSGKVPLFLAAKCS